MFWWKMREAHFPPKHTQSGERRRREQAIAMEIRQTLNQHRATKSSHWIAQHEMRFHA
jgi:hypothetical protein